MRIALVQMEVEQGKKKKNLQRALGLLGEAAQQGADVAVLPETPFVGWLAENVQERAETLDGEICSAIGKAARRENVAVVSGITEKKQGCTYNSAVLFDQQGKLRLSYSKVNGWARHYLGLDTYAQGRSLSSYPFGPGIIALTICSDSWVPYVTQTVARMGARLILSPSAWACPPGEVEENVASIEGYYRERTTESDVYLVGVNCVGEMTEGYWKGRIMHGNSLVYGPGGCCLVHGPGDRQEILLIDMADAELAERPLMADATRDEGSFPAEG